MSKIVVGQWAHFDIGGASKVIQNLTAGLSSLEDVEVIAFYNEFSFPKKTHLSDPDCVVMSRFDGYAQYRHYQINDFHELVNYKLDVLNTHRSGDDFWAFPGFDAIDFPFKVVETNFQGFVKSRADVRIVPSKALREKMPSSLDIRIIPNPILPPATSTTLRDELGLKDKFVYGRVGRAESDVYSPINLRAYKQVENSSTCFLYVSPNRAARQEVASLGIKNIIFLNATLDEVELSKIYNTCDVVCHSNALGETFGNTIAEAMMHGKPVISHRGSPQYSQAQSELLGDLSARLFVGLDVGAYARAMRDLQNDEVRLEASRYVRERAQSLFDYQTVAREYARLYRSLLK